MRTYALVAFLALTTPVAYAGGTASERGDAVIVDVDSTVVGGGEAVTLEQRRARVIARARQLIGTAYRLGGQSPDGGFDCSGLVGYAFAAVDRALGRSSRDQALEGDAVPLAEARPGDIVVFARPEAPARVFHAGLITEADDGRLVMVHANRRRGVHATDILSSAYWREKVAGVRRVL